MPWWSWLFWSLSALLGLAALAVLYFALLHDRARARQRCPRCWYDMSGAASLLCPECGCDARSPRRLLKTRRRYRRALIGVALAAAAYPAALAPRAITSGSWWSVVPTPALAVLLQFYDDEGDQVFQRLASKAVGPSSTLSTWERYLLARRCGQILLEPPAPAASTPASPVTPFSSAAAPFPAFAFSSRQSQALSLLQGMGPEIRAATASLVQCVNSPSSTFHAAAIPLVGRIGPPARRAVPALGRALAEPGLTGAALSALDRMGSHASPAVPDLKRLLDADATLATLTHAARVLHRLLPDSEAIALFRPMLNSPRYPTCAAGANGLAIVGTAAIPTIPDIARAVRESPGGLRATGIFVLASFREHAVPAIATFLEEDDRELATAAAYWLGTLGRVADPAVPALTRALHRAEPDVRAHAANALGYVGPAALPALPEIERLVRDPDPTVRTLAEGAVSRLRAIASRAR